MTALELDLISLAQTAKKPWNTIDAQTAIRYRSEPQVSIDKCMSCSFDECCNCLSSGKSGHVEKKKPSAFKEFERLFSSGLGKESICKHLQITTRTYYNYKSILRRKEA